MEDSSLKVPYVKKSSLHIITVFVLSRDKILSISVRSLLSHPLMSDSATALNVARQLLWPWNFLGKNTGVGGHSLLQGIFSIQGLNLCWFFTTESPGKPPNF